MKVLSSGTLRWIRLQGSTVDGSSMNAALDAVALDEGQRRVVARVYQELRTMLGRELTETPRASVHDDVTIEAPPPPPEPSGQAATLGAALGLVIDELGLTPPALPALIVLAGIDGHARLGSDDVSPELGNELLHVVTTAPSPPLVIVDGRRSGAGSPSQFEVLARAGVPLAAMWPVDALGEAFAAIGALSALERGGHFATSPGANVRASKRQFAAALHDHVPLAGWGVVRSAAIGLTKETDLDEPWRRRASFARDVARRHLGETAVLEWPDDDWVPGLTASERMRWAAHAVQSAADGDLLRVDEYLEAASELLERHEADDDTDERQRLALRGAMGRALAALGSYAEAARLLAGVTHDWLDTAAPLERSRPLCEWLRAASLAESPTLVDTALEAAEGFQRDAREHAELVSLAFVAAAAGRALTQVGRHQAAAQWLASADENLGGALTTIEWNAAPAHVRAMRHRALRRASRALGRRDHEQQSLEELRLLDDPSGHLLAELEMALEADTDPRALLETLVTTPGAGDELVRTMSRLAIPSTEGASPQAVRALLDAYRY